VRYFVPDIRVPSAATNQSPKSGLLNRIFGRIKPVLPESRTMERLGGVPWGLDAGRWPKCSECGKSQSLLAQLEHHQDRLDLGREGRVLFVFQCAHDPGMCATWEAFSGANACFVVEPEQLEPTPTAVPADAPPADREVHIAGWIGRDDGVPPDRAGAFLAEQSFLELPEDVLANVTWSTRLGGVPRWMQSADEAPRPDWRFIGQLDGIYSFLSPPKPCPSWVSADRENWEGRTHVARGPNFGGGLAYLFLKDEGGRPEGCMFWQR
jgi:hypothetical protein